MLHVFGIPRPPKVDFVDLKIRPRCGLFRSRWGWADGRRYGEADGGAPRPRLRPHPGVSGDLAGHRFPARALVWRGCAKSPNVHIILILLYYYHKPKKSVSLHCGNAQSTFMKRLCVCRISKCLDRYMSQSDNLWSVRSPIVKSQRFWSLFVWSLNVWSVNVWIAICPSQTISGRSGRQLLSRSQSVWSLFVWSLIVLMSKCLISFCLDRKMSLISKCLISICLISYCPNL